MVLECFSVGTVVQWEVQYSAKFVCSLNLWLNYICSIIHILNLWYLILSIKVNVRCACNMLKQEWICQYVLKEYRNSGRDPKEVPKSQFGAGLIACGEDCKKKVKVPDPELHLRKSQETKVLNRTPLNTKPCMSEFCSSLQMLLPSSIKFVAIGAFSPHFLCFPYRAPLWKLQVCPNAGSDGTADKRLKYQNSRCVV